MCIRDRFCWLLCSLGYQVTSYAGRFIYPSEAGIQMRRHRVLVVTLEGKRYLTETGMNSEGPRAPLVLAEGEAHWDGVTEYRLDVYKRQASFPCEKEAKKYN